MGTVNHHRSAPAEPRQRLEGKIQLVSFASSRRNSSNSSAASAPNSSRSARWRISLPSAHAWRPLSVRTARRDRRSPGSCERVTRPSASSRSTSWVTFDFTQASRSARCPSGRESPAPVSGYGIRSRYEKATRFFNRDTKVPLEEASSRTPLHDTYGIITPSALHFERHHAGVPELDPSMHTLTVHGLVERPLVFTVDDLKRMPSVSRIHFLECSGNSGSEWRGGPVDSDVQRSHGLTSGREWTGVPVATLLRECGVK